MNQSRNPHKQQPYITRITGVIWAACLLSPLFIIAGKYENAFVFHTFLLLGGWLSWAYTEYFIHRFIMHDEGRGSRLSKIANHNHHHTDPKNIRVNNLHRVLMGVGTTIFIVIAILVKNYFTIACGYMTGFTIYSYMHVVLHSKWSASLFPRLHRFHIMHHCKYPDKYFGVVFTMWDHLFGTVAMEKPGIVERIRIFYYKKQKVKTKRRNDIREICKN